MEQWLREDRKLIAGRIRRFLLPLAGAVSRRTVRRYVATLRRRVPSKEAFVPRSVVPETTMEVVFGESWVDIAGVPCKVKYLVATLPYRNAYFGSFGYQSLHERRGGGGEGRDRFRACVPRGGGKRKRNPRRPRR